MCIQKRLQIPWKCFLNGGFVLDIKTGGGFIQQDDGRILQESAGDGNTLALTAGKDTAVLADGSVPLVRKLLGKFLTVCQLWRCKLDSLINAYRC